MGARGRLRIVSKHTWVCRVSPGLRMGDLRDRAAPDLYSGVTTSDISDDTLVEIEMAGLDAEWELLATSALTLVA